MALVAVVSVLLAGEPASTLPNIALILGGLQHCHPPVNTDQQSQADGPLNGEDNQVDPAEEDEPEEAVTSLNVGKLYVGAATLGASGGSSHN